MKKTSSSQYHKLVAGFAASSFALLVTVSAQQVTLDGPSFTASASPNLESCNAAAHKAEMNCEKKFNSCSKKITIKVQKCEKKVDKKQSACFAKAEKARQKCLKKNDTATCQTAYDSAQETCSEVGEDAALVCKELEENLIDCEEVAELCNITTEDKFNDCMDQ